MTPKQRVLDALNHKEPDRIPLDLGGTVITGINRRALIRFLDYAGIPHGEIEIQDVAQQSVTSGKAGGLEYVSRSKRLLFVIYEPPKAAWVQLTCKQSIIDPVNLC